MQHQNSMYDKQFNIHFTPINILRDLSGKVQFYKTRRRKKEQQASFILSTFEFGCWIEQSVRIRVCYLRCRLLEITSKHRIVSTLPVNRKRVENALSIYGRFLSFSFARSLFYTSNQCTNNRI